MLLIYPRQMADYPRVDANNSYLLARYDGAIIDGKPWGLGRISREHPIIRRSENQAEQCLNDLEVSFYLVERMRVFNLKYPSCRKLGVGNSHGILIYHICGTIG